MYGKPKRYSKIAMTALLLSLLNLDMKLLLEEQNLN